MVSHAVDDGQDAGLNPRRTFFKNLYQKPKHSKGIVTVGVIKVLDNAFCPLKGFFSESPPAVKRHHRGKVLQLLALLSADPCNIVRTGDAQVIGLLIVHDKVWKQSNEVHWETKALGWVHNSEIELSCHP